MAVAQVNGSAADPKYRSSTSKNNSGVVVYGGNTTRTDFAVKNSTGDNNTRVNGTGPKITNGSGLNKALSAGTFAVMTAGLYVIRKITTTLAGVANTSILSGASDFGHRLPIAFKESQRTTFLSGLSWAANPGKLPTYTLTKSNLNTSYGNDNAARPTLAIPGELTYIVGKTPINDDYKAKTLG